MYKIQLPVMQIQSSMCPQHKLPYDLYCSHEKCAQNTRMCKKCKQSHSEHPKFFTSQAQVVDDIKTGLKKCMEMISTFDQRVKQLDALMNYAKNKSKQEYENMECNIIEQMKSDKSKLERKIQKMEEIYLKLEEKDRLKTYFAKMQKMNLLKLKIKLSNQQGMKNFKQKNEKLCQLIQKSNFEDYQRSYDQFNGLRKQFEQQIQNNSTFKIGQIVAMKNSKRQMTHKNALKKQPQQNDQNNNQPYRKRQKAKPKTTLNFQDGIISGILNYLNI